jgi:hypothetical protein
VANLFLPVDPPEASAASFGLVNSGTLVKESDDHWQGGFAYPNHLCRTTITNVNPIDSTKTSVVHAEVTGKDIVQYVPFVIDAADTMSTIGWKVEDLRDRLRKQLELCTQKAVEREFWTGALAQASSWTTNQYLAAGNTAVTNITPIAGPVAAKTGLAMLEEALGSEGCGLNGTIHGTRGAISSLIVFMERGGEDGDTLYTPLGNMVIAGSGYTGTSPTGAAPTAGQSWLYATGPVSVRLGDIQIFPDNDDRFNTSINNVEVRAERYAAATWSGCAVYAINVTL